MWRALPVFCLLAVPAAAEDILSPKAFRDYSEGYTLYFERDGAPFGAESFGKGGETMWRFQDGTCVEGLWRAHGAQICFLYEDSPEAQCWRMLKRGETLTAKLLGDGPDQGMELQIVRRDREPLLCRGGPGSDT